MNISLSFIGALNLSGFNAFFVKQDWLHKIHLPLNKIMGNSIYKKATFEPHQKS